MQNRVAFLDGVRGIAIGAVLMTHWVDPIAGFGYGGLIGVDVFFVLSGFVITTILWRATMTTPAADVVQFLRRRVRRLYPALVGVVVVATALVLLVPDAEPESDATALTNGLLTLTQLSWLPWMGGEAPLPFGVTWSLGAEWMFYLVWPWLVWRARKAGVAPGRAARIAFVGGVVLYLAMLWIPAEAFYYAPFPRFGELMVGGSVALAVAAARDAGTTLRPIPTSFAWAVTIAVAAYVLVVPYAFDTWAVRLVGIPLATLGTATLLWWHYAGGSGALERVMTWAPLVALGQISYSLYLWHAVPAAFLDVDVPGVPGSVTGVGLLVLSCGATWLSYIWLERPFTGSQASTLSPDAASAR
ncbi:acyltransferase [Nocardioides sp. R-C-SC26]|uniref:acyltransferase family protein n=1 Tax=Nocardioides sp. R-C-SC26 TaxID=2870414 RepID=UPI001E2C53D7|nr:acyltransferase [Nocardioides sp. R-C-SC26]